MTKGSELSTGARTLDDTIIALRNAGKLSNTVSDEKDDRVAEMTTRILAGESAEEILGGATGAKDIVGQIVVLQDVNFLESAVSSTGWFAVVGYSPVGDGAVTQGRKVFTCGSARMLAQLAALLHIDVIPGQAVRVGSASVEYQPGAFGDTYFLEMVR